LSLLHFHPASNFLESASAGRENVSSWAAHQERTLVIRIVLENRHHIDHALEGLQSQNCGNLPAPLNR
jgi:hypothetical protein